MSFREIKRKKSYEKPSEKEKRKRREASKKRMKALRLRNLHSI
jgi:ribosomal protein S21